MKSRDKEYIANFEEPLCQISDFGLAKLMPEGQESYVTARVQGTFGYFDPEYTSVSIYGQKSYFPLFYSFMLICTYKLETFMYYPSSIWLKVGK